MCHFVVDLPDAVEMRVVSPIDLVNDRSIGGGFVGTDRDRFMLSHAFNRIVKKGFGSLCIASRGEANINHLANCIDGTPQIKPSSVNAYASFVCY